MFKRVEKRIKKREEDVALDIDYEALGLNETDSDDSEESDIFDQQDEDESEEWGGLGGEDSDVGEDYDHMEGGSVDEHDTSEEEDVGEKRQVSFQAFTVDQALKEPIYPHPSQSNASLCALCPGKMLIGPLPISQHQESKAHARRSKRISELAALPENKARDFSDLLVEMGGGPGKPQMETEGESKRAEKKRKSAEIWKAKREKLKERDKARKEKQKQDAEADDKRPTKPDHVDLSDAKKQKDGKRKATSAETTSTTKSREDKKTNKSGGKMPQPSASNVNDQALQTGKRKRKPETEKDKKHGPAEKAQAPPSKKRKMGADNAASSSEKTDITRQIKDIAKSASKRAHQALGKANKGSEGGVLKTKGGKKKKSG